VQPFKPIPSTIVGLFQPAKEVEPPEEQAASDELVRVGALFAELQEPEDRCHRPILHDVGHRCSTTSLVSSSIPVHREHRGGFASVAT
jgi:hypothetical protein